ncbi:hypothetical protein [Mycobacteroides abscessus]|uniref:Uncharacterized protein n=1 Tax=Mycobacteroides abscessus TaxID=36809 RepID=A0A0U0ZRG8_9MYCO|nr:hypothetical protein [Mycobacteroides abscessus]CPV66626.1 Uncharacterised protein [Mycobacteroides abscessus]
MSSELLPNTAGFGAFLTRIRTVELDLSLDAIAGHGGLSRTDQGRIEKGAEIPLTSERLARTATALTAADPHRFPVQSTESFLTAVATAHAAAAEKYDDDGEVTEQARRSAALQAHGEGWNGPAIIIGTNLSDPAEDPVTSPDELVIGRAVVSAAAGGANPQSESPARPTKAPYWESEAGAHAKQFADSVIRIASRHREMATTCSRNEVVAAAAEEYWRANVPFGTVQLRADLRMDPLAGPTTMSAARRRAKALRANPSNLFATACVIFLANAVAATEPNTTPLSAWLAARADSDILQGRRFSDSPFYAAYEMTKERLPAEYLPQYTNLTVMLDAAEGALSKYVDDTEEPLWDMSFIVDSKSKLNITVETSNDDGPYTPAAGDLIIHNQLRHISTLNSLVADMGIPTMALDPISLGNSAADAAPVYHWCPIPDIEDQYAVLYDEAKKTWIAAQLY